MESGKQRLPGLSRLSFSNFLFRYFLYVALIYFIPRFDSKVFGTIVLRVPAGFCGLIAAETITGASAESSVNAGIKQSHCVTSLVNCKKVSVLISDIQMVVALNRHVKIKIDYLYSHAILAGTEEDLA